MPQLALGAGLAPRLARTQVLDNAEGMGTGGEQDRRLIATCVGANMQAPAVRQGQHRPRTNSDQQPNTHPRRH